jgi:flagellar protein FliO/FliZ
MPSITDTDSIILGVAAFLFAFALIALVAWAFKTFVLTGRSGPGLLRGRDRRLGVVETASVDGHRKLILIRRDTVEHLIMTGGPVDVLIETGIEGQRPLEPPLEDVIIARAETRPAPDFSRPEAPGKGRFGSVTRQNLCLTVILSQRWFRLSPEPSCARQDIRTYGRHVLLWQR